MSAAVEFAREQRPVGRVRRGRRRLGDRHRQGGRPAAHQPRRAARLRQRPGRRGRAPQHPLAPLVAVPTTTGTGSESTTDLRARRARAEGEDRDQPPAAAPDARGRRPGADADPAGRASRRRAGWTSSATPWRAGPPGRSLLRPQAARAAGALLRREPDRRHVGGEGDDACWPASFRRAVAHGDDREAREQMALAATFAGHGLRQRRRAHPARQRLPDRRPGRATSTPTGYPADEPMVPHGMAVALTAPEAFRFTFDAAPERHLRAAELLAPGARPARRRPRLAARTCSPT